MDLDLLLQPDPGFWSKTSWIQLGYGVWVTLTVLGIGTAFGFPAVALPQLTEPDSEIHPTLIEQSWIASVLTLSSPIGCLLSGCLMDRHGRRLVLLVCQLPMCIGWLYMSFAQTAQDIIIGRIINGVGCGMAFSVPRVYLTEISLPNMRGVVGALPNIALAIGITLQAGLGSLLRWHMMCYICSAFSIALMCFNYFLPETPYFVLIKGTQENSRKALVKFRSAKHNINAEMEDLMDFKLTNNIHRLPLKEQLGALFSQSACRPFEIVGVYLIIMQLSGVSIMVVWTIDMLEDSKSTVDPHMGNFLIGMTRFFMGVLTAILLFKIGRKLMALTSALGLSLVCFLLGAYIHYTDEATIFPQICYMAYTFFAILGYYCLPFLIMSELYPLQVRGLLSGITMSLYNVLMFGTNFSYPYLKDALGLANTILVFGGISLLGYFYLYFYLPETKDLTLQEIEEFYNKHRPTLVSQRHLLSVQLTKSRSTTTGFKKSNLNIELENRKSGTSKIGNIERRKPKRDKFDDEDSFTSDDSKRLNDPSTINLKSNLQKTDQSKDQTEHEKGESKNKNDQSGPSSRDTEKH